MDFVDKSKSSGRPLQQRRGLLLTAASAATLLSVAPVCAAHAEVMNPPEMLLSDVAPVSDTELAQNRGGFSIGNISLWVGMTVTTTIAGASDTPIAVTTNFTIDSPGQLSTLGPQISGDVASQVSQTLADVGIGAGSGGAGKDASASQNSNPPPSPPAAPLQVADNTPSPPPPPSVTLSDRGPSGDSQNIVVSDASNQPRQNDLAPQSPPPPPPPLSSPQSASSQVQQNAVPQSPPSPPAPSTASATITDNVPAHTFTKQVDPKTNSISLTNNLGTNINVSAVNGLVTTITNDLSGVSVKTQVDLNYVINNYHDIIANAQSFQQAMNIAQQMLAVRGITGH